MFEHPMDKISVRPIRFTVDSIANENLVWSRSSPEFSMFINAMGVHIPHFERYLIAVMREFREELKDNELKKDVQAIIGQEAHHAFNFSKWTKRLATAYPRIQHYDNASRMFFTEAIKTHSKKHKIGFTAGYETFTFLAGMIILDRFEELMGDAEPHLRALWVWHQVEEVEHGAVAFDFYKAFFPEAEWYRRVMVLNAFLHISKETFVAFREIVRHERRTVRSKLKAWSFFIGFAKDLFKASLPVYARSYHPRNHPICNDQQNPIAVGWRLHYSNGGDPVELSDKAISRMRQI